MSAHETLVKRLRATAQYMTDRSGTTQNAESFPGLMTEAADELDRHINLFCEHVTTIARLEAALRDANLILLMHGLTKPKPSPELLAAIEQSPPAVRRLFARNRTPEKP